MGKRFFSGMLAAVLLMSFAAAAWAEEVTIPDVEVKQFDIPDNEAMAFIRDMKTGWNLGNTFDASDCYWLSDEMAYESAWCGVKTPEGVMDALLAAGFQSIRIPVSWHNHLDENWVIHEDWMNRVQEVTDWAYSRGMYVILNIHHDCDKAYYYPDSEHLENSEAYMRTIWSQVAARFADYDEHLIFDAINEPRLKDTSYEWYWDPNQAQCQDAMACIVKLNQVFVDTVRAAGGYNESRYLMCASYDASPWYACEEAFTLPEDTADNRIIVSAHAYTPYDFALNMNGTDRFSLDNSSQVADIASFMNALYETWISKGIPVLMGEYGAMIKGDNLQDRVDWVSYYVLSARNRGMSCLWWDNNLFQGNGERFGLLDRTTLNWNAPILVDAIMRYCQSYGLK